MSSPFSAAQDGQLVDDAEQAAVTVMEAFEADVNRLGFVQTSERIERFSHFVEYVGPDALRTVRVRAFATLALLSCLLNGPLLFLDLAQHFLMILRFRIILLLVRICLRRVDLIDDLLSLFLSLFHVLLHLFGVNRTKFFLGLGHNAIKD